MTLGALTLLRLPEASSICSEASVSLITRPAWNLPPSSKRAFMGRRLSPEDPRPAPGKAAAECALSVGWAALVAPGRARRQRGAACDRREAAGSVGVADRQPEGVGGVRARQAGQGEQAHHHLLHLFLLSLAVANDGALHLQRGVLGD